METLNKHTNFRVYKVYIIQKAMCATNNCTESSICLCVHQWQSYKLTNWGPSLHSPRWKISLSPSLMLLSYFVILSLTKNMPQRCTFLINKRNSISSPCTLTMQASLDLGRIPFSWKRHWSSRYFRKGNRSAESSNRPISLTTIVFKMCEHIVHCANIGHLSEIQHDTLTASDLQHGFRKRSCDTQLIRTIHDLVSGSEEKEHTDPILLDFAKAFDKVTSCLLQHQIEQYGVKC